MSDTLVGALIGAVGGVLAALLPLLYIVRKDRRQQRQESEQRKTRELERYHERREHAAIAYLALLGALTAALDALRLDADNADDLLHYAGTLYGELQKYGQSEILFAFGEDSAVVWTERANRRLLRQALDLAREARTKRETGEQARATEWRIQQQSKGHIDAQAREVFRIEVNEAINRSPEVITSFASSRRQLEDLAIIAQMALPTAVMSA